MTVVMQCVVEFPANAHRKERLLINRVNEVQFSSTWKELTSRGSVTLPRNVKFFEKNNVKTVFQVGDEIKIYLGYNEDLKLEFSGYVSKVSADIPIVIEFEDEMYKVRKLPVNFSSPDITLDKLIRKIVPGYELDVLDQVAMGSVRLAKTQVGAVLDKIQKDWGLYSYMRDKTLVVGKYYERASEMDVIKLNLERECVSTALNYQRKEDVKINIKAVSTLKNGEKISIEGIGDPDGNERQLTFFNIMEVAELERIARLEYEKYKVDKFEGSFTTFGIPLIKHGMKCELSSNLYPDRTGVYYVEGVTKSFNSSGFRQDVQLGEKVS